MRRFSTADLLALRDSPLSQVWPSTLSRAHLEDGFWNPERWHAKSRRLRGFLMNSFSRFLLGDFKGNFKGGRERAGAGGSPSRVGPVTAHVCGGVLLGPKVPGEGDVPGDNCGSICVVSGRGRYGGGGGPYRDLGARVRCLKAITCSGPSVPTRSSGGHDPQSLDLRLMLCNARSVVNKAPLICDLIQGESADLMGITETWLGPEGGVPLVELCPPGFRAFHQPRAQGRGGGVAVVIKEDLEPREATVPQIAGCESLYVRWGHRNQLGLLIAYLAPCCVTTALPELLEVLAAVAVETPRLIVMGDFNLPSVGLASTAAREFQASMTALDLIRVNAHGGRHAGSDLYLWTVVK
ncbi:uncharacterized protein LOC131193174 [Ahaetulla prasina]|uniref:uncharacterized protein LOC131193174 n=1 Tax=Ahaetulla prasina TaxID=499056 RepID=UPI002647691A|nr:uncharacterized protein LOC131193174 [Ahaetulla prasina]XP_058029094.1 uncharacterized protein LOC131193174 [Ahaetulla prasina]XP_058029095.1 uncharacterized protein LOC131193174 [Ahaetulla prasina]